MDGPLQLYLRTGAAACQELVAVGSGGPSDLFYFDEDLPDEFSGGVQGRTGRTGILPLMTRRQSRTSLISSSSDGYDGGESCAS